ncbi:efflux transporter outer membrane subunit [Rhodanobacter geophilus]|uniref:Efflux transporter outer membrane subunit n=1 Tax=Rhodanobacter geophilus TaxID=3162488 RepID=A0ABV3QL52_9GAMM
MPVSSLARVSTSFVVRVAALAVAPLLLAACAAGPDFKAPAPPAVDGYAPRPVKTTAATPNVAGGSAQHFEAGAYIPGDWWTLFHSAPLDALIETALKHNHDLKAAQAALRVAHENMLAQRGAFLPSVSANLSASRQRQPGSLAPVPESNAFLYNLYTPQLSISYTPDVFGGNRRAVESLQAQEQAARFQMIATWNTLASNVAVAAIQLASLQAQIDATRQLVDANTRMLDILRYQYDKGYASRVDLAAQESQLAQTRATLPPLEKQLLQQRDQLAVLAGRFPSQATGDQVRLDRLQLPTALPLSLPSALVAQRPDVRQAQANLHAASAEIGVATAARLPNITLSADAGSTALEFSRLFTGGTGFWDLGAGITAPIFEGGSLLHQQRAAKAAYVEASEQYRSTVLAAFQNVADTLAALDQDAKALQSAAQAEQAAKLTLDLTEHQLKDGYASNLQWLTAEQTWQQARITLVQAQANRFADTAALYQALGGGWWHHPDLNKQ